jgi:hypothetical protein
MTGRVQHCSHRRRARLMTGTDRRIRNQAVHGYSIARAGKPADQDAVAVAAAAGMWYDQAGDDEIVAAAARTEARVDSVVLEC